jgi:hypothetical protein
MDFLSEIFSIYKRSSSNKIEAPEQMSNQTLQFGDIIEIYTHNQLLIAVAISESEAMLMSEFYELGTHTDLIIQMQHPIAEKWIIQTDKRLYLSSETKYNICCSLNEEDKTILKDIIEGKSSIPIEKSGPKTPLNPKDPRYKFKRSELKKTILVNKHLFFEEGA